MLFCALSANIVCVYVDVVVVVEVELATTDTNAAYVARLRRKQYTLHKYYTVLCLKTHTQFACDLSASRDVVLVYNFRVREIRLRQIFTCKLC